MNVINNAPERERTKNVSDTRCQNCGTFVTRQFARVFGNNQDQVFGCFECMTATDVKQGKAHQRSDT